MRDSLNGATIAFDLDGTLVDTAPDLIGALNVVLGERGLPHVADEAARVLVGRGARALIERGFASAPTSAPTSPSRSWTRSTSADASTASRAPTEPRPESPTRATSSPP